MPKRNAPSKAIQPIAAPCGRPLSSATTRRAASSRSSRGQSAGPPSITRVGSHASTERTPGPSRAESRKTMPSRCASASAASAGVCGSGMVRKESATACQDTANLFRFQVPVARPAVEMKKRLIPVALPRCNRPLRRRGLRTGGKSHSDSDSRGQRDTRRGSECDSFGHARGFSHACRF